MGRAAWTARERKMLTHTLAATVTLRVLWLPTRDLGPSGEKQEGWRRQERALASPLHSVLPLPVNLRSPALGYIRVPRLSSADLPS